MSIPNEAVEAAHLRIAAHLDEGDARAWKHTLRLALEAAAPYMAAQALEDAAAELDDKRLLSKAFHIFYPEWLRERAAKLVSK